MRYAAILFLASGAAGLGAEPAPAPAAAERALHALVERQEVIFADLRKSDPPDIERARPKLQQLAYDYEDFLKRNPKYGPGHAAYGVLLGRIEMRRESAVALLKANELLGAEAAGEGARTPAFARTWALVKNQLGNYVAEEGRPIEAANYFLAAIDLVPVEPLYHFQLGTLLAEARDAFLKSGQWTREKLDGATLSAFRRAAELAPERADFGQRAAEAYYDLEKPDWDAALKAWGALEEKAGTALERETARLHAANILIKLGKPDHARALVATVSEPSLAGPKEKLLGNLK